MQPGMDRAALEAALAQLGRALVARAVTGDLYVVGGAALALAYDARRATRDIDAVFEPKRVVYEAAAEVAEELGLPLDWLNDGAKAFVPAGSAADGGRIVSWPGLRVQIAAPTTLLAMKVAAARVDEDEDDIAFLAQLLGLTEVDEVLDLAVAVLGRAAGRLTPRSRLLVEVALEHPWSGSA